MNRISQGDKKSRHHRSFLVIRLLSHRPSRYFIPGHTGLYLAAAVRTALSDRTPHAPLTLIGEILVTPCFGFLPYPPGESRNARRKRLHISESGRIFNRILKTGNYFQNDNIFLRLFSYEMYGTPID